ncbi:hypothetical protein [Ornithinibacillus sp. 179-J 7C1 HS]|uniref:hypothetical protein n=1 Tax=Ornithinibacillus sp. 179-J 7C1 HS TaxID=3142384 RepID=UPI0039A01C15
MKDKSYVYTILAIVLTSVLSVGTFNFLIDPLWTFGANHEYNDVQTVINERQQKTNSIYFREFEYDTLLLGSSRSTYINQYDFEGMNVYNYAVADMSFKEYNSFIEFAKEIKGGEFDRVIIGVDFFKSSKKQSSTNITIDSYSNKTTESFYRYKNLISLDTLEYSIENFQMSREDKIVEDRNYNRFNVADAKQIDPDIKEKQTLEKIQKFKDEFFGDNYDYNPAFTESLRELKENNPNTEFIVFTTPVYTGLYEAMVEEGQLDDYHHWIEDIVSVFGGVYHFMYPNSVTDNMDNYFDGHHFYPHVGTMIAKRISNSTEGVPDDFGIYIDTKSIPWE